MAGTSKRTSVCLAVVAVIFIIVIIILCLTPDPCYPNDDRAHCQNNYGHGGGLSGTSTESTTESTTVTTKSMTTTTSPTTKEGVIPISTPKSTTDSTTVTTKSTTMTLSSTTEEGVIPISTTNGTTTTDDLTSTTEEYVSTNETTSTEGVKVESTTTSDPTMTSNETTTEKLAFTEESTTDGPTTTEKLNATKESTTTEKLNATEESTTTTEEPTTTEKLNATEESTTTTEEPTTTEKLDATETSTTITEEPTTTQKPTTTTEEPTTTQEPTTTEEPTTLTVEPEVREVYGNFCNTPICREVARRMLDIMDPRDISPCDDFYQFSCGGMLDDHFLKPEDPQVPANEIIKDALSRADRDDPDIKNFLVVYDSCMNYTQSHDSEQQAVGVSELFKDLGYEFNPKSNKNYSSSFPHISETFDLSIALAKMMKRHFTPFFDILIDVQGDDPDVFTYKMTFPAFGSAFSGDLAQQTCYAIYKGHADQAKAAGENFDVNSFYKEYVKCMRFEDGLAARVDKIHRATKKVDLFSWMNNKTMEDHISASSRTEMNFMWTDIAEVMPDPPEIRKELLTKNYEEFTIRQLDDTVFGPDSPINFSKFFKELLGTDSKIDEDYTKIQVYFKKNFIEMFEIINDYYEGQEPVMQNIMLLMWLEHLYSDLMEPVGSPAGSPEYCFNAVTSLMDEYVSFLYMQYLPKKGKLQEQMERMIRLSKEVSETQLNKTTLASKDDFLDKLEEMTGEVMSLAAAQKSLEMSNDLKMEVFGNDFMKNYNSLMQHYRRRLYKTAEFTTRDARWTVYQLPYKISGVSSYGLNEFLIPYGAMAPPYYYEGVPGYINYAGIGHMIAHELMHGFDSTGMKYKSEGRDEMTKDMTLVGQSECLGEFLQNRYTINNTNIKNGLRATFEMYPKLSMDEFLADSAATRLSWNAYQKDLENIPVVLRPPRPYRQPVQKRRKRDTELILRSIEGLRNRNKRSVDYDDELNFLEDQGLVHLEKFSNLQLFYIKMAQNQCSDKGDVNIIRAMENEHMIPRLRVNLVLKNEPLFMKAFKCDPLSSTMVPRDRQCPYRPTGDSSQIVN